MFEVMNKPLQILLTISAAFYLAFIFGTSFLVNGERYFILVDDAMISMRYAQHLAQGHGFVWNIGEAPVQGFTNLGWTLYMAFLHLLPFAASKISLAVMLSAVIILLANILVVYKISQTLLADAKYGSLLAAIITAFYFPLVFWSLRGMEVGLLTLLINLALLLALKQENQVLLSIVISLAVLVRIDAAISAILIASYFLIKRRSILPLVAVVLAIAAVLLFQKYYFGDLLPNTYHQKMDGYSVIDRMRTGVLVFSEFASRDVLMLLFFSLTGLVFYRQYNSETFLLLGIFLAQCAYSIYVGGDYAEPETNAANRFIAQGMPALFILFGWMTNRFISDLTASSPQGASSRSKLNPAIPLAIMTLLIISGEPWFNYTINNAPLLKADIRRVKLALHIKENTDPTAVIAVHAAGQIPYFSERTTIDLLGLNDPVVAHGGGHGEFYPGHNKWDYAYSIDQLQPDLIADNFAPLSAFMKGNDMYQQLDSDIYVRIDSQLIDIQGLTNKDYR